MIFAPETFRAVLYDLDGTLLDTIGDISHATNFVLRSYGFPEYEPAEYRLMVGWGLAELMRRCIPQNQVNEQLVQDCVEKVKAEYAAHPVDRTRPYNGIASVVTELHKRGYAQAVLSNKAHELTTVIVEKKLPRGVFQIVQGQKPSLPTKPDPKAALGICEELGLSPYEVLYVGDTAVDMETAKNAGMVAVGVSWGFRSRREVTDAGAQLVIDDPEELIEILPGVRESV